MSMSLRDLFTFLLYIELGLIIVLIVLFTKNIISMGTAFISAIIVVIAGYVTNVIRNLFDEQ